MMRRVHIFAKKGWNAWCFLLVAVLLPVAGCAPKNVRSRTPDEVELAIVRMSEERTGQIGEVCSGLAESLAAWRAHRVAELPLRSGLVRVSIVTDAADANGDALVKLAMPDAEALKASEDAFLTAAGLIRASVETPETVIIRMVVTVSSARGCHLEAELSAARVPEWREAWDIVPAESVSAGKKNGVESR